MPAVFKKLKTVAEETALSFTQVHRPVYISSAISYLLNSLWFEV